MHILICSPEGNAATGNWVTATRYRHALQRYGHRVTQCQVVGEESFAAAVRRAQPDLLLLLHAYRVGRLWLADSVARHMPTLVMLSGTDINEGLFDADQVATVEMVMRMADGLLAQNPLIAEQLRCQHPHLAAHLHALPPGIELGSESYALRERHQLADDAIIFLCPAGIRAVKGLLALLTLFDGVTQFPERGVLAFCGPVLDAEYARQFFAAVAVRSWAHYLGVIAPAAMAAVLRQADVVVNNSSSEGLSNVLLEAASVGTPILANDIVGNRPVVEAEVNGLLYRNPATFQQAVQRLLDDDGLRHRLSQPQLRRYHPEHEAHELQRLCCAVLAERHARAG